MAPDATRWPHAPPHDMGPAGTYFVTASTYGRLHHFRGADRVSVLHRGLLALADQFGWTLQAWAVFSNHYHFIAKTTEVATNSASLATLIKSLHSTTGGWLNRKDRTPGRQVWYNYRETHITYPHSYFARLNYTIQNPVRHGLVPSASLYPWCSASWFERTAPPSTVRTIYRFKTDRLSIEDDFEPSHEW